MLTQEIPPLFLQRQSELIKLFESCLSQEAIYQKIIEMGRYLPSFKEQEKTEKNLVKGCQSTMYLHGEIQNGLIHFSADSEALISKGLAALLFFVYNDQIPAILFQCPPTFLTTLKLSTLLTPGRSHGLNSLFTQMQRQTLDLFRN